MNRICIILTICTCLFCFSGCSSDKEMRELMGDDNPRIFIDKSTGKEYMVSHYCGNTYSVKPIKQN